MATQQTNNGSGGGAVILILVVGVIWWALAQKPADTTPRDDHGNPYMLVDYGFARCEGFDGSMKCHEQHHGKHGR